MKKNILAAAIAKTIAAIVVTGVVNEPVFAAGATLEEVLVTARRREENLQRVPVAVTALDPQKLAEQGIASNQDLKNIAPSLIPTNLAGSGLVEPVTSFAARGRARATPTRAVWSPILRRCLRTSRRCLITMCHRCRC